MTLNLYVYARDNPMKIVDLAGHEWWSPVSSFLTAVANTVTSTVTTAAVPVTNWWNSMPPSQQQAIEVTAVIAIAAVATVATAGIAAPVVAGALSDVGITASTTVVSGAIVSGAVGATVSATSSLVGGLIQGNASPDRIAAAATIGAISGGIGAVVGPVGSFVVGTATTIAN